MLAFVQRKYDEFILKYVREYDPVDCRYATKKPSYLEILIHTFFILAFLAIGIGLFVVLVRASFEYQRITIGIFFIMSIAWVVHNSAVKKYNRLKSEVDKRHDTKEES